MVLPLRLKVQKGGCPPLCLFVELPLELIQQIAAGSSGNPAQPGGSTGSLALVIPASGAYTAISDASFVAGSDNLQFTHSNGALTYVGTVPRHFLVHGAVSGITSNDSPISIVIMRNGVPVNGTRGAGFETFDTADTHQVNTTDFILLNPGDVVQLASRTDGVSDITSVATSLSVG